MTWLDALILGLIQGLTEFLPVSSSGHLELGTVFLNVKGTDNLLFSVLVHGATALSTIIVFRKDIIHLAGELLKFKWNDGTKYATMLAVSMIPVGVVGILWESEIEAFFGGKVIFVASMLMITAVLLTISHFVGKTEGKMNYLKAFTIGISQAFALLPGISRSGATISTALILGIKREEAARFSFLMVLVPIIGATVLKIKEAFEIERVGSDTSVMVLLIGFIAAFISGLVACKWMVRLVKRGKLLYFAIYCFILSSIVLITYW